MRVHFALSELQTEMRCPSVWCLQDDTACRDLTRKRRNEALILEELLNSHETRQYLGGDADCRYLIYGLAT